MKLLPTDTQVQRPDAEKPTATRGNGSEPKARARRTPRRGQDRRDPSHRRRCRDCRRLGRHPLNGSGIYTALLTRKVPKGTNWFYTLGSATMFIFAMQAITGVFLSMYYTPSATQAYASITHMTNDVFMGEFVRGMHKWGASLMIILIFLHMARTFFFGAYKYPRELNWVIGVVLIVLTMVMGLTGYLLPFDQRSFWATIVANNITASGPVVGPYLADFLRAGPDFSATTLSRFYALHMLLVPGLIGALIAVHLFLVVKLGTTAPPWVKAARPKGARPTEFVPAGVPAPEPTGSPVDQRRRRQRRRSQRLQSPPAEPAAEPGRSRADAASEPPLKSPRRARGRTATEAVAETAPNRATPTGR